MYNLIYANFFKSYNRIVQNRLQHISKRGIDFSYPFFNGKHVQTKDHTSAIPHFDSLKKMTTWGKSLGIKNIENTYLLGVQHFLPTTASFFEELIRLGFNPNQMLFADKSYSTVSQAANMIRSLGIGVIQDKEIFRIGDYNQSVVKKQDALWGKACNDLEKNPHINSIIILDEGGRCTAKTPPEILSSSTCKIMGIEQTRFGLYNDDLPFPIINLASAEAKTQFISQLVAETLIQLLENKLSNFNLEISNMQIGVIGYGAIGRAVVSHLLNQHPDWKIVVYDENIDQEKRLTPDGKKLPDRVILAKNEHQAAVCSDCLLGCTGKDIAEKINVMQLARNKVFVSCSSEDKEFKSLIKQIANENKLFLPPMSDLFTPTDNDSKIFIPYGGYPINLNGKAESDPHQMVLMRLLLMGSMIQCLCHLEEMNNESYMHQDIKLDPYIQCFATQLWAQEYPLPENQQVEIYSEDFFNHIKEASGGNFIAQEKIKNTIIDYQQQLLAQYEKQERYSSPAPRPT